MHTAPAEVTPESESSPDQLGTQPEPISELGTRRKRRRIRFALSAAALLLSIIALLLVNRKTSVPAKFLNAPIAANNPAELLRLKGTTEAVESRVILAPLLATQQVSTLTLIRLTPGGTRVKKGDILAEFDRQTQMKDSIDKQADYQKLVDQVAQERAKESAAKAKDETALKAAENSLHKAELEMQKSEIASRIDAEKNQENLDEAKATWNQLRETFELKRQAAQAGIRILEIQRDRTQQTMLHARANADLMVLHSPLDGVVVLNTIWKQGIIGEVQDGDQVQPGMPFMQVVDPSAMQVRVLANQQDFPALHIGQSAKVRLDAYPDMVFAAKLEQMAPVAQTGDFSNRLRTFVVLVSIQGNDPRLMPDLSAAVDVDTSKSNAESKSDTTRSPAAGSGS